MALPVLHELLGRLYTDAEWEALCDRCGECCFESHWVDHGWTRTDVPCPHLGADRGCTVYADRQTREADCIKVTPSVVLSGILPVTCAYREELRRLADEDWEQAPRGGRHGRRRQRR